MVANDRRLTGWRVVRDNGGPRLDRALFTPSGTMPLPTARSILRAVPAAWSGLATLFVLAGPAQGSGLEEIVVTAQRQPVAMIATPLSIDRVGAESIRLVGATHSSEILNRVAGAMVQRGSGQESLTAIRSPVLTGAGSCGAFLFLENGIAIRPVGFCNVNELLEVNTEQADAIEVLRGTGTALQGSNAVHGMVNVLQDAPARLPDWRLGLGIGPDDYLRASLVAAQNDETAGAAIKALYTHDGGWRDDSGFDEGKLNATVTLGAGGTLPSRIDLSATLLDQETAGFITGKDAYRDPELSRSNPNPEAFRDAHAVRLTGLLEPATAWTGTLQLRPYLRSSRMEFLQHFLPGQPLERNGQDSAGLITSFDWRLHDQLSLDRGRPGMGRFLAGRGPGRADDGHPPHRPALRLRRRFQRGRGLRAGGVRADTRTARGRRRAA